MDTFPWYELNKNNMAFIFYWIDLLSLWSLIHKEVMWCAITSWSNSSVRPVITYLSCSWIIVNEPNIKMATYWRYELTIVYCVVHSYTLRCAWLILCVCERALLAFFSTFFFLYCCVFLFFFLIIKSFHLV